VVYEIAPDGTESTLYNFAGGSDGSGPVSLPRLFADKDGNLYGTTMWGGGSGCSGAGCGTIFEVTPSGTETVLHSFNSATDGAAPYGGVIRDNKGNLYGTTSVGGSSGCSGAGCGTVYELTAGGTFTVLHTFGGSDGESPQDGLVRDKAGNLYGTTIQGGGSDDGVVFEITRDGTFSVLHSFTGGRTDGQFPRCAMIMDASGNLYGTTHSGGQSGVGTIFEIGTNGTESLLKSFTTSTGKGPSTLSMDGSGNLYGTTQLDGANGLGTIFELTTTGTLSALHSFSGGSGDGYSPIDGVTINKTAHKILGTTVGGGGTGCGGTGCGTVYELKQ
jgi:uncharacterized repeat protein (TIGR03803 family)